MGYALKIYEAFREYGEEKARILAEAFEELEKRYPQILDMATRKDLSEAELKLTKEIEQVKFSTIKWIVALIGGQTVVLISSFFAILRHFLK